MKNNEKRSIKSKEKMEFKPSGTKCLIPWAPFLEKECTLLFQREARRPSLANSQNKPCSKFGSSVGGFQSAK